jgi:hypothetical protein
MEAPCAAANSARPFQFGEAGGGQGEHDGERDPRVANHCQALFGGLPGARGTRPAMPAGCFAFDLHAQQIDGETQPLQLARRQRGAPGDHGGQHAMAVRLAAQSRQSGVAQRLFRGDVQEVVAQIRRVSDGVEQERKAQILPLPENR